MRKIISFKVEKVILDMEGDLSRSRRLGLVSILRVLCNLIGQNLTVVAAMQKLLSSEWLLNSFSNSFWILGAKYDAIKINKNGLIIHFL